MWNSCWRGFSRYWLIRVKYFRTRSLWIALTERRFFTVIMGSAVMFGEWCACSDCISITTGARKGRIIHTEHSIAWTTRVCRSPWEKLHETRGKTSERKGRRKHFWETGHEWPGGRFCLLISKMRWDENDEMEALPLFSNGPPGPLLWWYIGTRSRNSSRSCTGDAHTYLIVNIWWELWGGCKSMSMPAAQYLNSILTQKWFKKKKKSFLHNSKAGYLMNTRKWYTYNAKQKMRLNLQVNTCSSTLQRWLESAQLL